MSAISDGVKRTIVAALVLVAVLLAAGDAFAHASLIRSSPADGAVLATAPSSFALTFSEPTSPLSLKLVGPDGSARVLDKSVLRDATIDIVAPTGLDKGSYVLSWRVVSEDGHPVGGSAVFSIGAPSARPSTTAIELIDWPIRSGIWLAKIITYAALFIGIGGVFFQSWIGDRSASVGRLCTGLIIAGLAAVSLSVGFQGLDALGLGLANIARPTVWSVGFSTSLGNLASLAIAAMVTALVAMLSRGRIARPLSLIALALVGIALASSGHASAAQPQWLTRPAVFLHGVGIAFWAGALVPLASALASRPSESTNVLRRFSKLAPWFVLPLIAAGVLLAFVQVRALDALWTTAYGNILVVKLALLVPLFALAVVNRLWLTKPAQGGEARATMRLRRSVGFELVLIVLIFAIAGLWRFTPPPRALAEAAAVPAVLHIHSDKAMADLEITPGKAGPVRASIAIMTGDFGPLDAKAVTLVLSNPDVGIEAIRRPAQISADGVWSVEGLNLPVPGIWKARIDILISDFELVKLEDKIELRP
ncbi:copper resistance CopC/CopD family protein [Kaistia terrae]|uniref:Copper resistance CopC/CopD family protein n=1 Tax=Kaistia terrae TaxID=537017 RepID=A0ABW0Q772_9HYPH|nr:copper resistance CopC/CopD family protein [Kaistia terrae]MCX5578588.1 copper resistance CopC/CopD family protein [Kaistia terrae]